MPAGLVAHMRLRLQWDVLFVVEEDALRRAPDVKHYRLAQQLGRTLVTMDRDYLDDKRFPPDEGSGVLVINAPDEQQLTLLLERIDRDALCEPDEPRHPDTARRSVALPLAGRKLQVNSDWGRETNMTARRSASNCAIRRPLPLPSTTPGRVVARALVESTGDLAAAALEAVDAVARTAGSGPLGIAAIQPDASASDAIIAALKQRYAGPFLQHGVTPAGTAAAVGEAWAGAARDVA